MNPLFRWLGCPEWEQVVRTLAHSVWQGALLAGVLVFVTRRFSNPVVRYRCAVAALVLALTAGVVTWAVIENQGTRSVAGSAAVTPGQSVPLTTTGTIEQAPSRGADLISAEPARPSAPAPARSTAWIALLWLAGAAAMLVRAGIKVAGAETLRRSCQTSVDPALANLLYDARRAIGLTRRVRLAVTDKLTSPVVVGWLVPTLILPLTLVTTMPPEQIRFILLHELAHVRRGDYLVNLFQLFVESVFFFNPAIWWISHQIRREREACCDALASRLGGEPVAYARTLIEAAERGLTVPFAAAPALGERRPSQLTERVRRILVPDYRPSMHLTWRAASMFLVIGGASLMLSAVGARVAVAAILTPEQRIERIGQKMTEYGQNPQVKPNEERVPVTVRIKTPDGSPLPDCPVNFYSLHGTSGSGLPRNGVVNATVGREKFWVEADAVGYAPTISGPFDATVTNRIDLGELILNRGFDVSLQVIDAKTDQPIPGVQLSTLFWLRGANHSIYRSTDLTADSSGRGILAHCVDQPLTVTANAAGYEIGEQRFEHLQARQVLVVKLTPGAPVGGEVVDKMSGGPVAGATMRVLYGKGPTIGHYGWNDSIRIAAETDAAGRFVANQFRRDTTYWFRFSAPGHESLIVGPVVPGTTNLTVRLGPELVVRGRIIGDLSRLYINNGKPSLPLWWWEVIDNDRYVQQLWAECWNDNGVTRFKFTLPVAGLVKYDQEVERIVNAPVDDWVIDLNAPKPSPTPQREVVFSFKYPAGAPPHGTVWVKIDDTPKGYLGAHSDELQITNGQVSLQAPLGSKTGILPMRLPGYWFEPIWSIKVTNGPGPMVIDIPLAPAGAIYARALEQDGSDASALFGVEEIKRAPSRSNNSPLNSFSSQSDRWTSGTLPLGGVYQIYAWRDYTFAVSKPIKLTEKQPDAEIELRLPAGKTLNGLLLDPVGRPIPNVGVTLAFTLNKSHGFGLPSVFTDEQGRFQITNATPEVGRYTVEPSISGLRAERVDIDADRALQTIQLKKGFTLSGQVIEENTGHIIPNAEIRAVTFDQPASWPEQKTTTDAQGRFQFTTLADVEYNFYFDGGQDPKQRKVNPAVTTNIAVAIKLSPGSQLKPAP